MAKITLKTIKAPKDIFTKIYKSITRHPERWDQQYWHRDIEDSIDQIREDKPDFVERARSCGTAHCFAGWGLVHTRGGVPLQQVCIKPSTWGGYEYTTYPGEVFNQALINAGRKPVPLHLFDYNADRNVIKKYIQRRAAAESLHLR